MTASPLEKLQTKTKVALGTLGKVKTEKYPVEEKMKPQTIRDKHVTGAVVAQTKTSVCGKVRTKATAAGEGVRKGNDRTGASTTGKTKILIQQDHGTGGQVRLKMTSGDQDEGDTAVGQTT